MTAAEWKSLWQAEEAQAHIHGWDFSHIQGRFAEEHDLPWNYRALVREHLRDDLALLDYDTGGGGLSHSAGRGGLPAHPVLRRGGLRLVRPGH